MSPLKRLFGLFRFGPRRKSEDSAGSSGPATHVVILDGTLSSLAKGYETNAGLTYKLLREAGHDANLTVYYEAGIQWKSWRDTMDVMTGDGIDAQIARAYGVLASRYRDGDRIVLMGYSRGAYAARSLGGMIGRVGLLRQQQATARGVRQAFRHYRRQSPDAVRDRFRAAFCHPHVPIAAIGVWDTVRALGLPLVWRLRQDRHAFHDHHLDDHVLHGFHALALNERRRMYSPVMWTTDGGWSTAVEQVWFRGTHADVGGHIMGLEAVRPLSNVPLVWMLERMGEVGMPLPPDWTARFPCDAQAPSVGQWIGWSRFFVLRRIRDPLADPSERLHETVEPAAIPTS